MILPFGNVAFADNDKKEEDKHEPIKITIYEWGFSWPPVYRLAPTEEAIDCVSINSAAIEAECEL